MERTREAQPQQPPISQAMACPSARLKDVWEGQLVEMPIPEQTPVLPLGSEKSGVVASRIGRDCEQ